MRAVVGTLTHDPIALQTAQYLTRARAILEVPHGADPLVMATMLGRVRAIVEHALRELDGPTRGGISTVEMSSSNHSTVLVDRSTYLEGLSLLGAAWVDGSYARLAATLAYVADVDVAGATEACALWFADR